MSPAHEETDARSAANPPKSWNRLGEQPTAILFLAAVAVAMAGWLYLLAQGLWAAANWLLV